METNISPVEHKSNGSVIVDGSISTNSIGKLKSKINLKIKNGYIEKFNTKSKSLNKKFKIYFTNIVKKERYWLKVWI